MADEQQTIRKKLDRIRGLIDSYDALKAVLEVLDGCEDRFLRLSVVDRHKEDRETGAQQTIYSFALVPNNGLAAVLRDAVEETVAQIEAL